MDWQTRAPKERTKWRSDWTDWRTYAPMDGWSDALTDGDPVKLAMALRIYWRAWLCQLRMTDETLTNNVKLRWCFEGMKRRMHDRSAQNGKSLRAYIGMSNNLCEAKNGTIEGWRADAQAKARNHVGHAATKSQNSKKIADVMAEKMLSKFESSKSRLSPQSCNGWRRTHVQR